MAAVLITRAATKSDIPQLVRLCEQASTAGVCPGVPMDQASITEFAEALLEFPNGALVVAEQDSKIVAAGGAVIVPYHFNKNVDFVHGVFLWRDIEEPSGGRAVVEALEGWGRANGAHKILLTTNDTLPGAERGAEYLSRRGYRAEETNYVRTL